MPLQSSKSYRHFETPTYPESASRHARHVDEEKGRIYGPKKEHVSKHLCAYKLKATQFESRFGEAIEVLVPEVADRSCGWATG